MRPERRLSGGTRPGRDVSRPVKPFWRNCVKSQGRRGRAPGLGFAMASPSHCARVLELGRWQISQRRVQPFPIIDALQKFTDAGTGILENHGIRCDRPPLVSSVFMNDSQAALANVPSTTAHGAGGDTTFEVTHAHHPLRGQRFQAGHLSPQLGRGSSLLPRQQQSSTLDSSVLDDRPARRPVRADGRRTVPVSL